MTMNALAKASTQDNDDQTKTWSIKEVTWEARNAAIGAARRSEMTMGQWLSRNIPLMVKAQNEGTRALTVVAPAAEPMEKPEATALPACTMDDVMKAMDVAAKLAEFTGKVPRSITRAIERQVRANLGS